MNAEATKARAFDWRRAFAMDTQITQLLAITVIVFVVMAALSPEKFLRPYNFEFDHLHAAGAWPAVDRGHADDADGRHRPVDRRGR